MDKEFTKRKPDFQGFACGKDGKINDWSNGSGMWLNDEDRESGRVPEKPFSINNDHSPRKMRFFPTQQIEKWRADNETERREFEQFKEAKRQQGITEEKNNN